MKNYYKFLFIILVNLHIVALASPVDGYETITVDAPFRMEPIKIFQFPKQDFPITDYGAVAGGEKDNTKAIAAAIAACNKAGGGRVVVPAGIWLTGAIHFKSNVNLHLEENAVLSFSDNPSDYLPAVMTSWEGMECYNYSPLLYAFECKNVAITGKGMLKPKMDTWKVWFKRPKPHMDALKELYTKASTDVPVIDRQMAVGENNLRPHLIHFNRCENVLLDGFMIRESPFWTIHLYMCNGGVVRHLDVKAHGHNNDGIDLEMSRNFLVENCTFDQGDDAVVIKSGRNRDAWRLNTPCENIVIRNCTILKGHTMLGIGSEMSGGVRNIYMHDCSAPKSVNRFFFIKTNHRRGGFVENIYMENVKSGTTERVLEIDTEVLYQWKDLVPTYETRITRIDGIYMKNVTCETADAIYELKGNPELPINNVEIENVQVGMLNKFIKKVENARNVKEKNITYSKALYGVNPADTLIRIARYKDDKACAISYTFDDGLKEHYTLVAPYFKKLGIKGTFWINGSKINKDEKSITDTTRLTWLQLKEMSDDGHEISNHGWAHKNFGRHTLDEIREDIHKNDGAIFMNTGIMPRTFCYPNNAKTPEGIKLASKNRVGTRTKQRSIGSKSTPDDLDKWVNTLIETNDWGVGMTHGITYGYDAFRSPIVFWDHLDKVKTMDDSIWIATFHDVAAYIEERKNLKFMATADENSIVIEPKLQLDKEIFKEVLTMVIDRQGLKEVNAEQGGKAIPVRIYPDKAVFDFDPYGGNIKVDFK